MAGIPYIYFYQGEYLNDTQHLTREQHGSYLLLLMSYWNSGKPLNNTNGRLAVIAKMTKEEWEREEGIYAEFFDIDGDVWTHGRCEFDLERVRAKSKQAAYAGRKSAESKAQTKAEREGNETSTGSQREGNGSSTDVQQEGNETSTMYECMDEGMDDSTSLKVPTELANLLADKIEANGSKRPNVNQAWIDEMDYLIRIDKREVDLVRQVIEWSQNDSWWMPHIHNPKKLREKFDQLRLKMLAQKSASQNGYMNTDPTPVPPPLTDEERISEVKQPTINFREIFEESRKAHEELGYRS
jgi:uncharacterized protein YdaU (DUF1376 family)